MERDTIRRLFKRLDQQPHLRFPKLRESLDAPKEHHGVYVIRNPRGRVEHVGRTLRGRDRLLQRLRNHLRGQSSYIRKHHAGDGNILRSGYTYQYLAVANDRARALLEHYATAWHCPVHLGLGLHSIPANET
jgi:hypothetical protein